MSNNKTILVTGGAGFIGSCLVRHLITSHPVHVVNLDKLTYAGNKKSLSSIENSDRYHFVQGDINDRQLVSELLTKHQPFAVMHLAAESHVDRSIEGPADFIRTNILGTFNLLECSLEYWKKNNCFSEFRFHQISTDEVFGSLDNGGYFREDTKYDPSSPYSASKASSDHLVRAWSRTFGLPVLVTNCSNNYGPYQYPEKLIPLIISNAIRGKKLPVYGDGMQIRDWLYVEDHVQALMSVLERGKIGETYNIGGDSEMKNIDVVKIICAYLDQIRPKSEPYSKQIEFVTDRPGHDRRYAIDCSKIKSDLGWSHKESFESGIKKTVDWYLSNEDWIVKS